MKARKSVLLDWIESQSESSFLLVLFLLVRGGVGRIPLFILLFLPLILIGLVAVLALIIVLWPWAIVMMWQKSLTIMAKPALRVIAVSLIVVFSFLLYLARTYMRPIFGVAEVCIGIATCWGGLSYANPPLRVLPASLAVVGGIYIIIRGFDNIVDDKSLIDLFTNPPATVEQAKEVQVDSSAEQIVGRERREV